MITTYADYLEDLVMRIPGCKRALLLKELKASARRFCQRSEAWRPDFKLDLVAAEDSYELALPDNTELGRIINVTQQETELSDSAYAVVLPDSLISDPQSSVPASAVYEVTGSGLCNGESPNGFYALADSGDGYIRYSAIDLDFDLLVSLLGDRCDIIQTSPAYFVAFSLTGTEDPLGTYTANQTATGTVVVAEAEVDALDYPAIELVQAAPSDVTEGLLVQAVLIPQKNTGEVPIDFMNRYAEGIVSGALEKLLRYPQWRDPRTAEAEARVFERFVGRGRKDNVTGRRGRPAFKM